MKKFYSADDHVLPRPVERLPDYANAKARRSLSERLVEAFGLSGPAADAVANAVVDPSAVRKYIGDAADPQVEEIAVPGGTVLGIRTIVWSRRIMPDPRNPRIGPSRKHPIAVEPGTAGEDSRFRPVPEPRSPEDKLETSPELVVEIESRHHLEWASAQAADYVLAENDWRVSIASQGVMEAVWVAATTYLHDDGSAPVTVPTTVEGSSRTTAVHDLLNVRSSDIPYEDPDQKLRTHYRKLNEVYERGIATGEQLVALRCERMPALILVGFRRNASSTAGFPTAVKSLVALRHVDPPKPWGDGPENESLADEVLDELCRRKLITTTERAYYAGAYTKTEARAARLSDNPACRAAKIVALFAQTDERTSEAIRVAVTSQSTRKRITKKMCNELATALIVRSVAGDVGKIDQVRRYMRHAFGQTVHHEKWESTDRDTDSLAKEALADVLRSIGDDTITEPGPASLELAVRAAYPLVVTGGLNADRGTANNNQPDRRTPGEVLDAMRRTVAGIHQLVQALKDFAADQYIRAVDEKGDVRKRADGIGDLVVSDIYLREQFPPPGKVRARSSGTTPMEQLKTRLADLSDAMDRLEDAFKAVGEVKGNDGHPLVDVDGVDIQFCSVRRQLLSRIGDELNIWGRLYRRRHGTATVTASADDTDDRDNGGDDFDAEVDDVYNSSYESWDESSKAKYDETTT
ncbi:hypothetical protein [Sorangium atrum]|uniref:Uncharacterized protein n=1 Tax=Sorangium atrum TaxID=2995308 RepID=A0ABT5BRN5_9BACT|nr:hypothetical protein [Sorangium aterium]MDC0676835.1 hypothetical protein [Sorangium aterium]